jgi:hypothetical protein
MKPLFTALALLISTASASQHAIAEGTQVALLKWESRDESLVCTLTDGPTSLMEGVLFCRENEADDGTIRAAQTVLTYTDDSRAPIALAQFSTTLMSIWSSAAYQCFVAFGRTANSFQQIFSHCTKGGYEVIGDGGSGIAYLVTDYEMRTNRPWFPARTTIYYWKEGRLVTRHGSWSSRFKVLQSILSHKIAVERVTSSQRDSHPSP